MATFGPRSESQISSTAAGPRTDVSNTRKEKYLTFFLAKMRTPEVKETDLTNKGLQLSRWSERAFSVEIGLGPFRVGAHGKRSSGHPGRRVLDSALPCDELPRKDNIANIMRSFV